MTKVVITGVGGFIGYSLAKECLAKGALVIGVSKSSNSLITELEADKNFSFSLVNIENKEEVDKILSQRVNVIYHLAGQPFAWVANSNPRADLYANVVGTVNILEKAREVGTGKVIFPSTGDVYRDTYLASELSPAEPRNFYGLSKLTSENYIRLYHELFHLNYTILRISVVYGPHFKRNVLFDLIDGFAHKGEVALHTSLDSEYDFIFIDDVIQAMLQAGSAAWDSQLVNISSGVGVSVRQLLSILAQYMPVDEAKIRVVDERMVRKVYLNDKAKDIGWQPAYSLEEGIRRTLEWLQGRA